jgi:hypothetical protein
LILKICIILIKTTMEEIIDGVKQFKSTSSVYQTIVSSAYSLPGNIYHKFEEIIDKGNVVPNSVKAKQPEKITLELKDHQLQSLYQMNKLENRKTRVSSCINMGVLADNVGSGKSLTLLSLIASNPSIKTHIPNLVKYYDPKRFRQFYGFIVDKDVIYINSNLIVVPHGNYHQWLEYITTYTSLTYLELNRKMNITSLDTKNTQELIDYFNSFDIVLCKSTRYNDFAKYIYSKLGKNKVKPVETALHDKKTVEKSNDYTKIMNTSNGEDSLSIMGILKQFNADIYTQTFSSKQLKRIFSNLNKLNKTLNTLDLDKLVNDVENVNEVHHPIIGYSRKLNKGVIWSRVIFDEANSINIPTCQPMYGYFNWFITSSVNELLLPRGSNYYSAPNIMGIKRTGFIRNTFYEQYNIWSRNPLFIQDIFIKNKPSFVKECFAIPEPKYTKLECFTPVEMSLLKDVVIPDVMKALTAGDTKSAINQLGCHVADETNIMDAVAKKMGIDKENTKKLIKSRQVKKAGLLIELSNAEILLAEFQQANDNNITTNEETFLIYTEMTATISKLKRSIKEADNKVKEYEERLAKYTTQSKHIEERVSGLKDKTCPICVSAFTNPVITPCCQNPFCLQCLTMCATQSNIECPMCRGNIQLKDLTVVTNDISKNEEEDEMDAPLPTKLEMLEKLVKENPEGKILIFSEYKISLDMISSMLGKNSISYKRLKGSGGVIKNIIAKFKSGETRVLLLNAKHYGVGLNLQMCSHIVLFHRMEKDMEKQIIGRGQRDGRTTQLEVMYLCHNNEL